MSYRQLLVRESLADVPVAKLMLSNAQTVPPDLRVQSLIDDYIMSSEQRGYPVVDHAGRLLGFVCLRDVRRIPRTEWTTSSVREIMTAVEQFAIVSPSTPGSDALSLLSQRRINQLVVAEHGVVRGVIRREDILRWLSVYGDADLQPRGTELRHGA